MSGRFIGELVVKEAKIPLFYAVPEIGLVQEWAVDVDVAVDETVGNDPSVLSKKALFFDAFSNFAEVFVLFAIDFFEREWYNNGIKKSPQKRYVMLSQKTKLVLSAMFCALVFAFTFIFVPAGVGNVNLGDGALLLAAWTLGGPWAAVSAAMGATLADLACGYAIYAPATFVIKAVMVAVALTVGGLLSKLRLSLRLCRLVAALSAELVMALGYLLYEATVLGYGVAAVANLPFNAVQGGVAVLLSGAMFEILAHTGLLAADGSIRFKKRK